MKWAYGGLAAAILIAGGAWFLMKGPAASAPPTLFQWQDYVDPHFTAGYEAAYHEKAGTSIFADEDEAFSKMRAGFKPDVMGPWASHGTSFIYIGHCSYFSAETLTKALGLAGFVVHQVTRRAEPGVYPANLRIFARKGTPGAPPPAPDYETLDLHIRAHLHALSPTIGYPRWALKLGRAILGV